MSIMIQGTGSNVGKSMLVAGIARALSNRGLKVAPFKPQNMSNNAAVTVDGGEIGRAQALQAIACRIPAHTDMNPVLLKPETTTGAQVILNGKRLASVRAKDYASMKPQLMPEVLASFERLKRQSDIVLVEGAGSPAEINLRAGDIANLGFAQAARVPVILAGDIDRGGVIAQMVGTHAVLPPSDRDLIKGFVINKFRGDPKLFADGYATISDRTGWTGLGILNWFDKAHLLPAEDSMDIKSSKTGDYKIVVLQLSRIANFDDLDPLKNEPNVQVIMLASGMPIPGDANLVIIPGSKSTRDDLDFLRRQGWDIDLAAHHRRGGQILGICGGFQMLGTIVSDPDGIEGEPGDTRGLGLLDVQTVMSADKTVTPAHGHLIGSAIPVTGYEIHIGKTSGGDCARPWLLIDGREEGATSSDGRIIGSYVHGIFSSDAFRADFLEKRGIKSDTSYDATIDDTLTALADQIETNLDLEGVLKISQTGL